MKSNEINDFYNRVVAQKGDEKGEKVNIHKERVIRRFLLSNMYQKSKTSSYIENENESFEKENTNSYCS